jgi:hypothetical protein
MAQDGRGNYGNHDQHVAAGKQSSGNTGNPEQHAKAGEAGAKAQPTKAKAEGGRHSHSGGNS